MNLIDVSESIYNLQHIEGFDDLMTSYGRKLVTA